MLSFVDSSNRGSRREFLRIGSLALGGLGLPGLWRNAIGADHAPGLLTDRSVVFVFMHGGPSQIETFDPKMDAPVEIASVTGEISTKLPGVTFGSSFPELASLADQFCVVRSFQTGNGIHDVKPVVSSATSNINLGSLYSRIAGQNRPDTGMPTNVCLFPRSVDDSTMPAFKELGDLESTGTLGTGYRPFSPSGGGDLQQDMQLHLSLDRLNDRRKLLQNLDRIQTGVDSNPEWDSLNKLTHQAFSTVLGGIADAFDLSREDPKTVAMYDTAPLVRPDAIDKKWNNHKRYADNGKSFGKLMLLARRLCERGCGFVTVTTNFVWDMHADQNNAGMAEGMKYLGGPFDRGISAFLKDLRQRGLSDKILLVCCGEMGRTPRINAGGGRDHWGRLAPLMLSGPGIPRGAVFGESTRDASEPLSTPVGIPHLVSTVLNSLIDGGTLRLDTATPREVTNAVFAPPIPFANA
ncbi:DUF1501 domain-containing protein [Thalassoglobus sp. JC818]|uniref:DUF1501 domain-containing protein n=1 Tax=Thalassoglobus sp. JC818 TaxID=3232136 RepID=UPI0034599C4F